MQGDLTWGGWWGEVVCLCMQMQIQEAEVWFVGEDVCDLCVFTLPPSHTHSPPPLFRPYLPLPLSLQVQIQPLRPL